MGLLLSNNSIFSISERLKKTRSFVFLLLFVVSFFLLSPKIANSGMYHSNSSGIVCAQCHTMHNSQGEGSLIYPGEGTGIQDMLLRAENVFSLCLYCHGKDYPGTQAADGDGNVPPKVEVSANQSANYDGVNNFPSAGDFNHGDLAVANDDNRHDLARTGMDGVEPPGYVGTWTAVTDKYGPTFNCLYCHGHHGTDNYRNLRYDPGNPTNDTLAAGVSITFEVNNSGTCSDGTGAPCDVDNTDPDIISNVDKYHRANVKFEVAAGEQGNRISEFCGKCHTNYYGLSGDANMGGVANGGIGAGDTGTPWVRHPVGDVKIGDTSEHSVDTLIVGSKVRYATDDLAKTQPLCLSCHYAHGGPNPNNSTNPDYDHSMLVKLDGADTLNFSDNYILDTSTSSNKGMMSNVCNKCHDQ